jgi:hypothetical protein
VQDPPPEDDALRFPSGAPPLDPFRLEYFAPHEPDRRHSRRVVLWSLVLATGWLPYACGVINGLVATQTYSSPVARSHTWGTVVFAGAGLAASLAAFAGFASLRHGLGVAAAGVSVLAQAGVLLCFTAAWLA